MADFEITNISMSKKNVALRDSVTMTVTLKNTHSKKAKLTRIWQCSIFLPDVLWTNMSPVSFQSKQTTNASVKTSIAYNKSASFAFEFDINPTDNEGEAPWAALVDALNADPAVRAFPVWLQIVADYASGESENITTEIKDAHIIRSYCIPAISDFKMERVTKNGAGLYIGDDEGESAMIRVALVPAGAEDDYKAFFKARLYYAQDEAATTESQSVDLSEFIAMRVEGVLKDLVFSNGSDWNFLLVFGDEYEETRAKATLSRAFATMHLSGKVNGGVSFGGFSSSTDDEPKFESHYPVFLYEGIKQIGDGWTVLPIAEDTLAGTTPAEHGGGELRCRKIENKCIVAGSMLVKPGSSTIKLARLPEGFMPVSSVFSLNACSGGRVARIAVHGPNDEYPGCLALSWVYNIAGEQAGTKYTDAEIWVQCSIEYWVN